MAGKDTDFDSPAAAQAAAMRLLSHREHARQELVQKLHRRGFSDVAINEALDDLESLGLLSDLRFAESYVRARVTRRFGPLRIRAELRRKGVADDIIGTTLEGYDDQWPDLARAWVSRRTGSTELDLKARARLYRSLANRGFSHEQAMQALNSFSPTP